MSGGASGDARVGIGARLRAGREKAGLTLLHAAEKLHVDPRVLEALESERFESLGAAVFARGHLRRYAELIGERAAELEALYSERVPAEPPDLTRIPRASRSAPPQGLAFAGTVVLVGFAVAGLAWLLSQGWGRGGPATVTEVPVSQPATPAEEPDTAPAPRATPVSEPPAPLSLAPERSGAPTQSGAAEPVQPLNVTLRFTEDSWVEIYDVNGERLLYGTGNADTVRRLRGTPPLRVVLGNAPAVAIEINGRIEHVPDSAVSRRDTAQFFIGPSGRIAQRASQAAGG